VRRWKAVAVARTLRRNPPLADAVFLLKRKSSSALRHVRMFRCT
jgi:hypothetical protein